MEPKTREHVPDLLNQSGSPGAVEALSTAATVDPAAQLEVLRDLVKRGLVSASEYERQRREIGDV